MTIKIEDIQTFAVLTEPETQIVIGGYASILAPENIEILKNIDPASRDSKSESLFEELFGSTRTLDIEGVYSKPTSSSISASF